MVTKQMVEFRDSEVRSRYLSADFIYRMGGLTDQEFSTEVYQILLMYLEWYGTIEPYYQKMKDLADERWEKGKRKGIVRKEFIPPVLRSTPHYENIKRMFLIEDLAFRKGEKKIFQYHRVFSDLLMRLLSSYEALEPYLTDIMQAAEKQWQDYQANPPALIEQNSSQNKNTQNENESLLWKVSGLQRSPK